ncbi:MAG TPA: GNAT family N-acetyltransferase [Herpetosiphonaceae bacterium]|nr:GNAT family N-acetyltransferase [Herpetosiphonaceae bacterium]
MSDIDIRALYDRYERHETVMPGFRREETARVVRYVPETGNGMVTWSRLNAEDADSVIDAELEYWRGLGRGFEWKLYDYDQPADLRERLAARGFNVGDDEAIMALDLALLPERLKQAPGVEVRRITDPADLKDALGVQNEVWQKDSRPWMDRLATQLREVPDYVSVYVAYVDGQPVCSAWINFPKTTPFASLWGGATRAAYRGRGAYTALVAVRAQEAVERGYRFLTIDASPMSRPIVAGHGFQLLGISNPCEWNPA